MRTPVASFIRGLTRERRDGSPTCARTNPRRSGTSVSGSRRTDAPRPRRPRSEEGSAALPASGYRTELTIRLDPCTIGSSGALP